MRIHIIYLKVEELVIQTGDKQEKIGVRETVPLELFYKYDKEPTYGSFKLQNIFHVILIRYNIGWRFASHRYLLFIIIIFFSEPLRNPFQCVGAVGMYILCVRNIYFVNYLYVNDSCSEYSAEYSYEFILYILLLTHATQISYRNGKRQSSCWFSWFSILFVEMG